MTMSAKEVDRRLRALLVDIADQLPPGTVGHLRATIEAGAHRLTLERMVERLIENGGSLTSETLSEFRRLAKGTDASEQPIKGLESLVVDSVVPRYSGSELTSAYFDDLDGRLRGLLIAVADQLSSQTTGFVVEYLDAAEYGLAFDLIVHDLLIETTPLKAEVIEMVWSLNDTLGLDPKTVEVLRSSSIGIDPPVSP